MSESNAVIVENAEPTSWLTRIGTLGAVFLGGVLLLAVAMKAIDPESFTEQIRYHKIHEVVPLPAETIMYVALGLETLLGTLLLFGVRRWWVLGPAALLIAFFLFLLWDTWQHPRGDDHACGCFGNLFENTPEEAFWRDLFLMVPPLLLALLGRPKRTFPVNRVGFAVAITAAVVVFAMMAPDVPQLDDYATRLKPGVRVQDLCVGRDEDRACLGGEGRAAILPELEEGRHLVVLSGTLREEPFVEAVPELDRLAEGASDTRLWVLTTLPSEEARRVLEWEVVATFDAEPGMPASLIRKLHRRLPRSFLVEDGLVKATWSGLPPLPLAE